MKPVLAFSNVTPLPSSPVIDLTALTGGALAGVDGGDWSGEFANYYTDVPLEKLTGGHQFEVVTYNGQNFYGADDLAPQGWPNGTFTDGVGNTSGSGTMSLGWVIGWDSTPGLTRGFDMPSIIANRKLHKLYLYAAFEGPAAIVMTATISDGSSPPAVYTPPNNNSKLGIVLTYRALHDESKVNINFANTDSKAGKVHLAHRFIIPAIPRRGPKSS